MFRKSTNNANFQNILLDYMVVNPVTGRWALGWSMLSPSISHRYCCGVSSRASSPVLGHWKVPASNRLYNSRKPLPSQRRPLIRSRRLPQNRNSVFVNGSSCNCSCTILANPSIPRRRSVYPRAIYTLPVYSLSMAHCLYDRTYDGQIRSFRNLQLISSSPQAQGLSPNAIPRDCGWNLGKCRRYRCLRYRLNLLRRNQFRTFYG